ncbi:heparinase II/III-family protein [Xanthobacter flavus]|uniref:heparinase II/III family protein n=1 Tax=Xanthobacter flavus TaxID=281 RepID=UPI0037290E17
MPLARLRKLYSAARHVPPRALALRLRREARQRWLCRRGHAIRLDTPLPDGARIAARMLKPDMAAFGAKTRALVASMFAYDRTKDALIFVLSGDVASLADMEAVPWTRTEAIAASDVNRCFFMSFVEQASLLEGPAHEDLVRLDTYVSVLGRVAPLGGRRLPIPWQPLPVARRLVNLVAGLALIVGRDPSLASRPEALRLLGHVALLRGLLRQIREDDLGYNHFATELFAQCVADSVFGDAGALKHHAREFVAAMETQVGPDGLQLERSATYQCHLLGHLDALIAGRLLPDAEHAAIVDLAARMRAALRLMTHPDGGIAVFNDAAVGDGPSPLALGTSGTGIADGVLLLADAGYARLQHGDFSAIFDAGPCGPDDNPGHAHADFLSFELDVAGTRLFVDPGVASYKGGRERDACRSAASHNGPTFAGLEPIEFLGAFRVGKRGRGRFLTGGDATALAGIVSGVGGTQDGFAEASGHVARWLGLAPSGTLILADAWQGLPERAATSTFLVDARHWRVSGEEEGHIVLTSAEGREVALSALVGKLTVESGASFHLFGPKIAFPAVRITLGPATGGNERAAVLEIRANGQPSAAGLDLADRLARTLQATFAR